MKEELIAVSCKLEDHTDKGYLIYVKFDDRQCAAEVLSLIRQTIENCFPDVPFWGEKKTESDDAVSFAYTTYIDEYNKLFKKRPRTNCAAGNKTRRPDNKTLRTRRNAGCLVPPHPPAVVTPVSC